MTKIALSILRDYTTKALHTSSYIHANNKHNNYNKLNWKITSLFT
jgi:hypothetical protein